MNLYRNWSSKAALLVLAALCASPAIAVVTNGSCPIIRGTPAVLSVTKTTSTTASLAWTVPVSSILPSGYVIESVGPSGTKRVVGNVTSYDLPISCATYTIRVSFFQDLNCPLGPWSNQVTTTCPPTATAPASTTSNGWTQIGAGLTFTDASVGSATSFGGIVGGKYYDWNGSSFVADGMSLAQVEYGNGGTRWGVGADTFTYRRDAAWVKIAGGLKRISVGDSSNILATNSAGSIYKWAGAGWAQMPGTAVSPAVGSDGAVWVLNAADQILRWNGTGWTQIPGALRWISVGTASNVWGVNASGAVYKYNTSTGAWDRPTVPTGSFIGVSTATDGTTLLLRSDGTLWKK